MVSSSGRTEGRPAHARDPAGFQPTGAHDEAELHAPIALKRGRLDALAAWVESRQHHTALQQDDRQLVELVATIASNNRDSPFLEALQIHSDDPR